MNLSLVILQTKQWYARKLKRLSKVTDFLTKSELKSVFALFCLQCYFPTIYSPIWQLYSPIMSVTKKKKKKETLKSSWLFGVLACCECCKILHFVYYIVDAYCIPWCLVDEDKKDSISF